MRNMEPRQKLTVKTPINLRGREQKPEHKDGREKNNKVIRH